MAHHLSKTIMRMLFTMSLSLVLLASIVQTGAAQQEPESGARWDPAVRVPSPEDPTRISDSWFPDLAVDSKGNVHVVWSQTVRPNEEGVAYNESAYYSMWDGNHWSQYNDIVAVNADIVRTALAIDRFDTLHFLYDFSPPYSLYYKRVSASEAFSAGKWSTPIRVNENSQTYMSDIVAKGDKLFVVYDDGGIINDENCPQCADIYFRYSPDLGNTWESPVSLNPTNTGSSRANIEVDSSDRVYVAWDEGWDRLTGVGESEYSVFMTLPELEGTWSEPLVVSYPNNTNLQLTVGADGKGGIMLVWRTASSEFPGIYWMWSTDYGESWSSPQTLPEIVSRNIDNPFDVYDMATDSAGHIHLVVVGYLGGSADARVGVPGVYHFEWDGTNWSVPMLVYKSDNFPEYPHIVVSQGNQLHATWFVRQDVFNAVVPNQVWYAHGVSTAPEVQPAAVDATDGTQMAPGGTAAASGDGVSSQTSATEDWRNSPHSDTSSVYTEMDDYRMLLISLLPVAILIVAVILYSRKH